jgi:hypothetical protein
VATIRAGLRALDERAALEATEWSIDPRAARVLLVGPLLAALALAALLPFKGPFLWLVKEDSLIEWLQFVALVVAFFMFVRLAILQFRLGRRAVGFLFIGVAAVVFVVAGEEISWGQRIFGFVTPAALEAVNHQGETNIHNIGLIQRVFNFAELAVGLYGVAASLIWTSGRLPPSVRASDRFLFVPPIFLLTFFLLPLAYRLGRLVLLPDAGQRITEYGELPELALYAGGMLFAILAVRVASEKRRETVAVPDPSG